MTGLKNLRTVLGVMACGLFLASSCYAVPAGQRASTATVPTTGGMLAFHLLPVASPAVAAVCCIAVISGTRPQPGAFGAPTSLTMAITL